ncbi:glycosyltransferase family 2 protein [Helicobacter equorum]|uniref:glycosyltransferase family 2 protein n=1 Tax=Helicobacter equorum TaxID=361872 RepID=UPI000CF18C1D|nr:glycosyltransferase [Helicobacter equorum]
MADSKLHTISIIIPCYNEKHTIAQILSVVQNVNIPYHKEIIIVNDCSTDGTKEILDSLLNEFGGGVYRTLQNPQRIATKV